METKKNNNASLKEIAELLLAAESVLIFPHLQMDGDALGSSAALCRGLRNLGKKADILIEDKIPDNIKFLDRGYCIREFHQEEVDVCIAVDCSDWMRIENRYTFFQRGRRSVMIDHHVTAQPFADFNYVDTEASSTGEIIFFLLKEMGQAIDADMGEALYTAIVTDTGRFMYSNTSGATHLTVAELYNTGMDHNRAAIEIYQKKRVEKVKLEIAVLSTMEMIHNGRGCIAVMTRQMLADTGAWQEETEGIVEELRNIDCVEISALLREEEDRIKVTMRSKTEADVSKIAGSFGGGGHKRAAGCTLSGSIDEAKQIIIRAVNQHLNDLEGQ